MVHSLLAVHISDGVLVWAWLASGFVVAALLLAWSARDIAENEVPHVGLLTAAFFVASLIHVRVGPTSVHLLLNGLLGVILGRRAILAIAVGLLLQAILLGHGGFTALGINVCIIGAPALLARPLFQVVVVSLEFPSFRLRDGMLAIAWALHPLLFVAMSALVLISILANWRSQTRDFRAGFLIGFAGVAATASLNAIVLVVAGVEDWRIVAALVLAAHIPIAFIEGFIVGSAVSFLRRVKPEMLPSVAERSDYCSPVAPRPESVTLIHSETLPETRLPIDQCRR